MVLKEGDRVRISSIGKDYRVKCKSIPFSFSNNFSIDVHFSVVSLVAMGKDTVKVLPPDFKQSSRVWQ